MDAAGWEGGGRRHICLLWPQSLSRRFSRNRTHPHLPTAPIQQPAVPTAVPHTQEQHQDLPCLQFGTAGLTSISRRVRNAMEHPGQLGTSPSWWDRRQLLGWDIQGWLWTLLFSVKCPDQAWLFPAGKTEVEELKLVQDPALASPGSLPGNCQQRKDQEQDLGIFSLPGDIRSQEMGGKQQKGDRAGLRYDQRTGQVEQWGKAGRKQQGCGNSWPCSARTHQ